VSDARYRCAVRCCRYIAESSRDGFVVCTLHDAPQVWRIVEMLQAPAAFWGDDRPIVLPVGELVESDLIPVAAANGALYAWQDERLANVPSTPSSQTHRFYDLMRGDL